MSIFRWAFALKGGLLPEDYFSPILKEIQSDPNSQLSLTVEKTTHNVTKKTILASESKNSQFTSICGIPIRTGNAEFLPKQPLAATENVIKASVLKFFRVKFTTHDSYNFTKQINDSRIPIWIIL